MPRILHIIPYVKLFPPTNGGQLRCFYLLRELSRTNEVHAVFLQPKAELGGKSGNIAFPDRVRVHSGADETAPGSMFDLWPGRIGASLQYRWLRRSWRGPANSVLLQTHHLISQILREQSIDLVLYEHISSMLAAPLVRRFAPRAVCVLDAHNIDHKLVSPKLDRKLYDSDRCHETHLSKSVDAFFACSDKDKVELEALNNHHVPGFTVPNGVDTSERPYDTSAHKAACKTILFCGSLDYEPNRQGLLWFHTEVWPMIRKSEPAAKLLVIGRNADATAYVALKADSSVEFIGMVDDVVPYYRRSGISIVPLRSGSGTRLKIMEAMSLGNPIVSTHIGAEGIEAEHGREILLADEPQEFAAAVLRLLNGPQLFETMRRAARQLVDQKYDWQLIGREMNRHVEELAARGRLA